MGEPQAYEFDDGCSHYIARAADVHGGIVTITETDNGGLTSSIAVAKKSVPDLVVALMSAAGIPIRSRVLAALGIALPTAASPSTPSRGNG